MSKKLILTFGYGNRTSYEELRLALDKYKVSFVIDVRKKPRGWSAIWSAQKLSDFCNSVGVKYLSKTALGNESGCSHWVPPDEKEAEIALNDISSLSKDYNVLLLCAEKDWVKCHRVEVSEKILKKTGNKVVHII
ncbi:DUF488 family protein [Trichothermofontia sp.]